MRQEPNDMNTIAKIRNYQASRARLVLTALVVGWAIVILQPCVMATPLHESEPTVAADHSGHALLVAQASKDCSDLCPHCGEDTCTGTSGCESSAAVNSKGAASFADFGTMIFILARAPWVDGAIQLRDSAFQFTPTPEALPRPVPLTVVNCVFLK
jgi:hypothetical protein